MLVVALRIAALVAIRQEHWVDAEQELDEGIALAREMPRPHAEARLLEVDGQRDVEQGVWHRAHARLQAALTISGRSGAVAEARRVESTLSELTTREGEKPDSILAFLA